MKIVIMMYGLLHCLVFAEQTVPVYKIMGPNDTLCGQVSADIVVIVPYQTDDGQNATASVPVPGDSKVGRIDDCASNYHDLLLTFYENWELSLSFTNDTKLKYVETGSWDLSNVFLHYSSATAKKYFPNITTQIDANVSSTDASLHNIKSKNGFAYQCKNAPTNIIALDVTVKFEQFTAQPFSTDSKLNILSTCSADQKTSDLVPIIVGACLVLLVIIVLVAYIIGRIRAKRQGYSSVE